MYSLNLKHGHKFEIEFLDSKLGGSFIQVIKTLNNQVVVGDIMNGVCVFDLVEGRQNKVTLQGPCSSHLNIWVNDIVILSKSQYLVADKLHNIFILERILDPKNEIQKYSLYTVAQINAGEELSTILQGSFKF